MEKRRKGEGRPRLKLEPPIWGGAPVLPRIRKLNRMGVDILCASSRDDGAGDLPAAVRALRPLWLKMDDHARARAAATPVLLLDLEFGADPSWPPDLAERLWSGRIGRRQARFARFDDIKKELAMDAWEVARLGHGAARLFGMSPGVEGVIRKMAAIDMDRACTLHAQELTLRWRDRLQFWEGLLQAALSKSDPLLAEAHFHAIHLLGQEC